MTSAPTDLVGQPLGSLQIERLLGQGGFSWVFAGREPDGTAVAVKVLKPRFASDPSFEARFRREAETAGRLEHANIVHTRAFGKENGFIYFTMDLCADSLAARLAREGPLPEPTIIRLAQDIAQGLGFAHERGFVHRDLKPENILLGAGGQAVISDFGLARALSNYVASTGVDMTVGTPQYLSPEQAQGRPVDHRADFYALGVTLYKAASGEVPFTHPDWFELARQHVEDPAPGLRRKRPELSKRFERVVFRCLAKHPDDRYQSAAELSADLAEIAIMTPPVKRSWGLIAVLGFALLLLVALVVKLMR